MDWPHLRFNLLPSGPFQSNQRAGSNNHVIVFTNDKRFGLVELRERGKEQQAEKVPRAQSSPPFTNPSSVVSLQYRDLPTFTETNKEKIS
jgi:hypothetical protein